MNAALETHDVTMRFGGNVAVDAVSLSAEAGRVTGLIGPNGAGKTTLFNTICGLLTPTSGVVYLGGTNVTKLKPYKRARQGLARTFQRLELWSLLTVRENVTVAAELRARYGKDGHDPRKDVESIIESVGLASKIDAHVDELPTGQARLVEIARRSPRSRPCCCSTNPRRGSTTARPTNSATSCARSRAREWRCCSSSTTSSS